MPIMESLKISIFRDNLENATFKALQFQGFKLDGHLYKDISRDAHNFMEIYSLFQLSEKITAFFNIKDFIFLAKYAKKPDYLQKFQP